MCLTNPILSYLMLINPAHSCKPFYQPHPFQRKISHTIWLIPFQRFISQLQILQIFCWVPQDTKFRIICLPGLSICYSGSKYASHRYIEIRRVKIWSGAKQPVSNLGGAAFCEYYSSACQQVWSESLSSPTIFIYMAWPDATNYCECSQRSLWPTCTVDCKVHHFHST